MPGWYPDPAGSQGRFRYWNGSAWSNETTANPADPAPGNGGGSRDPASPGSRSKTPLLIGGAVIVVALLIVAWFIFGNNGPGGGFGGNVPEDTNSAAPTVSGWDETSKPTPPPTDNASTIACPVTLNDDDTSQGSDGRIHGGGISVEKISGWSNSGMYLQWVSDLHSQMDTVRPGWMSNIAVGQLNYEDGFDSPEIAARQSMECYASSGYYENFTERVDLKNEATTVDGHDAWWMQSEVRISSPDMPEIEGDVVDIIVIDLGDPARMGIYFTSVTIGDDVRQQLVDASTASLRVE